MDPSGFEIVKSRRNWKNRSHAKPKRSSPQLDLSEAKNDPVCALTDPKRSMKLTGFVTRFVNRATASGFTVNLIVDYFFVGCQAHIGPGNSDSRNHFNITPNVRLEEEVWW